MYLQIFISVAVVFVAVLAVDNNSILDCMHRKYQTDLGETYGRCYNSSRALRPERVKVCYGKCMEDAQVVVTQNNKHVVDRIKFGQWADANGNKNIGKAMKVCYQEASEGHDMYKVASRASQCVFEKVKKTCS